MPFTITMPKLSPTMVEGTIAKWHKTEGQHVEVDEPVLDVATDKATIEYRAIDPGWIRQILVPAGSRADVGTPLAILTEDEKESLEGYVVSAEKPQQAPVLPLAVPQKAEPEIASSKTRIAASPLAKKLAQQRGISLSQIKGTGPRGRIMSRDVAPSQPTIEPLSPMRKTIADRLQYSKSTIPHFYISVQVEVSELMAFREKCKAAGDQITVNDLIIRASALALMKHPSIRSSFLPEKQAIEHHAHADIAVAVSVPGGLFTPIIAAAETKSLQTISKEAKALSEKARAGKLSPHEYSGGAFTISNLGMFGVEEFVAIINPPQVAILAVGAALDAPIFKGGGVAPGKVMRLTLSGDHRAIDGTEGAAFLKTLKGFLESPALFTA